MPRSTPMCASACWRRRCRSNYAILGYLLGRGEGSLGLSFQLLLNGINIVLSIYLGLELGWGVAGVAWGAVAGECIAAVIGLALVVRRFRAQPGLTRARLLDLAPFRHHAVA